MRRLFRQFSFPRRDPEPRRARDARLDPRGRRARLLARARLRRGVRQPRPARLLRDRRRRGRDRPAGRELALEQVPRPARATAPCCRSCTSTATRSPTRRCSRASPRTSCARCWRATAHAPRFVDRRRPRDGAPGARRRRSTRRSTRSPRSSAARAPRARAERPRWPMIVLRTPKGWTGPKEVDGLPVEGTWRSHQVPLAELADKPGAPAPARGVDALVPARGAVRRGRRARATRCSRRRRRASAGWAPTRTPTAALLLRDLRLPDFRDYAVDGPERRRTARARRRACSGVYLRDVMRERGPGELPRLRPRRDRVEPARRGVRGDRPRLDGAIAPGDDHLAPDGRVMEVLCEHLCQGWLEGYLLTGRHGLFNCYEAFIHIVDSMFNQHAKWLKVTRDDPVAAADRVAELPALLARLAPGPQRLLAPGPGLHRPRGQQEGRDRPRLPAAGRQLPAVGGRPLPAQPRLRQRRSWPASSRRSTT